MQLKTSILSAGENIASRNDRTFKRAEGKITIGGSDALTERRKMGASSQGS